MVGAGRLAATEAIASKVCEVLGLRHDLDGQTVLITAGPTCEDIDPVRFLTNRSSGKMGYALAEAAQRRGARVILVSGPTDLKVPDGVDWVPVRTTEQMHRAVRERAAEANIVVMAAAVADYRPAAPHEQKMKRGDGGLTLNSEPTPDILAELGHARRATACLSDSRRKPNNVAENARGKLERKIRRHDRRQ